MKLALRLALLTSLFVGACHCPKAHENAETGRWQLVPTGTGSWLLTDTATGHVWLGSFDPTNKSWPWHDLGIPVATK
jgi:hypothetical protein